MGATSNIEWTDASWTPIRARNKRTGKVGWHCEHATTGCIHCYSEGLNVRLGTGLEYKPGHKDEITIFLDEKMLLEPLRWKKPRMIFVCSMTDLFADFVEDEWIDKLFAVMALCPQHTFQVLTKRAERMREYMLERWQPTKALKVDLGGGDILDLPAATEGEDRHDRVLMAMGELIEEHDDLKHRFCDTENNGHWTADGNLKCGQFAWPLCNVWLGVSAERQEEADARIPQLLQTPAAIRFVSLEPLLGPIDLTDRCNGHYFHDMLRGTRWHDNPDGPNPVEKFQPGLDWAIIGGESGPGARPLDLAWVQPIVTQCAEAGTRCFVKQLGAKPMRDGKRVPLHDRKGGDPAEWPDTRLIVRQMPQARA